MAHRTATRIRLRVARCDAEAAAGLASRLAAHPEVEAARWSAASRSLVVEHRRGRSVEDLVTSLPHPAPATPPAAPAAPLWRQMLLPAAAMAAGLAGAAPLSTVVIAGCAAPIARRAARSLGRRHLSVDVLDLAAAGILLATGDVLAAGAGVGLVEVGERIRSRAAGQARGALRGWLRADARGVRLLGEGTEPRVPAGQVRPGDRVVVYAGETIPVDGEVVAGEGLIDTRTWTGEPIPRRVTAGVELLAGASVHDGRLVIAVRAAGGDTRGARLAAALEETLSATTRVSDMARRMADRFVLPVVLAGGGVLLATGDLSRLAAMLIVDFGTGVRISIPTAILAAMVAGAREDILFRSGRALEELAGVDTVVFDKTGTLTTGQPAVIAVEAAPGWSGDEVLRLAAASEGHLPHPFARAIRRAARRRDLRPPEPRWVRHRCGGGVVAEVEGRTVVVGDRRLLLDEGVACPAVGAAGSSLAAVAVDGRFAAWIRLRDRLRPEAPAVVERLRGLGIRHIVIASGDRPGAVRAVGRQLGADDVRARLMPEDKVRLVRDLRDAGRRVAVVGDGINDAAAMAEAHAGVALSRGADLAREAADVVLAGDDLVVLARAVELSRTTMRLVRQNVALVAAPNAAALGLATLGMMPPLLATAVNNGSTVVAAANGLRPLRSRRTGRPPG